MERIDFDLEQNTEKMIILINNYKELDKLANKVIKYPFENHKTSFRHLKFLLRYR